MTLRKWFQKSKIGVCPPRPFNPKKDKNFDKWLSRIEYHFALMGLSEDRCTAALLLQQDLDAREIAKYLGMSPTAPYNEAVTKLKDHYALTETPEELREKFTQNLQDTNKTIEDFAREIRVLASSAFNCVQTAILETLIIKQFVDGIRNANTRERLIVKRPATLTEAIHFAHLSEMATKVARSNKTRAPIAAVALRKQDKLVQQFQQRKPFTKRTPSTQFSSWGGQNRLFQAVPKQQRPLGQANKFRSNNIRPQKGSTVFKTLSPRPPSQPFGQ